MAVSSDEADSDFIDEDEMFSIYDQKTIKIAANVLHLAGFPSIFGEDDVDLSPFYWFCDVNVALLSDPINATKRTKTISMKKITLGTDAGMRSKSLIKSQSPNWLKEKISKDDCNTECMSFEEINIEKTKEYFMKKAKDDNYKPKKEDLYNLCLQISNIDPFCPKIPTMRNSTSAFYEWFGKNYKSYEILIHSF